MASDVVCPASLDPVCLIGPGAKSGDQNINLRSTNQPWLKRCFETTQAVVEASNLVAAGNGFPVLVIAVLWIGFVQPNFGQSNSPPHSSDRSSQAKQDKRVEKAKGRLLGELRKPRAVTGEKTPPPLLRTLLTPRPIEAEITP